MKIVFNELAVIELREAVAFYEVEVPGLGKRFEQDVKDSLRRIEKYPLAWAIEFGEIRKYVMYKFPFKLFYSVEENHIYIIAVAHNHRMPTYWISRLSS